MDISAVVDLVSDILLAILVFLGVRISITLVRLPELERIRALWLPILLTPVLLFMLAINHEVQDELALDIPLLHLASDALTLLVAALLMVSFVRFYRTWNKYSRIRQEGVS